MKSSTFKLFENKFIDLHDGTCEYKIDLLPAYAINYTELFIGGLSHTEGINYKLDIENSRLVITYDYSTCIEQAQSQENTLLINYFGIRDYTLLFPKISDSILAKRLGEFYEDSEKCFDNNAWLPYSLMCGAIFEGILFSKYNKNDKFCTLIESALSLKDIDETTAKIMNDTRNTRNLVHSNRCKTDYTSRLNAMDIRTTMDKLIKEFKY
ncbi:MAG TPA: hypothetical protein VIM70_10670 [Clostridium sp.]|uniref:hypothetical protein n=1 Tax=Clostridium sp. TaxID=1506 RepID=UPI002F92C89B